MWDGRLPSTSDTQSACTGTRPTSDADSLSSRQDKDFDDAEKEVDHTGKITVHALREKEWREKIEQVEKSLKSAQLLVEAADEDVKLAKKNARELQHEIDMTSKEISKATEVAELAGAAVNEALKSIEKAISSLAKKKRACNEMHDASTPLCGCQVVIKELEAARDAARTSLPEIQAARDAAHANLRDLSLALEHRELALIAARRMIIQREDAHKAREAVHMNLLTVRGSLLTYLKKSILNDGFPHPQCQHLLSGAHASLATSTHAPTTFVESPFEVEVELNMNAPSRYMSWSAHQGARVCSSESKLAYSYISPALEEILSCFTPLEDMEICETITSKLKLTENREITECVAKFWVLRKPYSSGHQPFCSIEVTLPHPDLPSSVVAKVFDNLCVLRRNFSVQAPFALISSYFTWWVCWLPDCQGVAQTSSATISIPSNAVPEKRVLHGMRVSLPGPFKRDNATQADLDRVQHFCRIVASAVYKSVKSGYGARSHALPNRMTCYRVNDVIWGKLPRRTQRIVDEMPPSNTKQFYVLNFLGEGVEGRVREVCDSRGRRCVMKTSFLKHNAGEILKNEQELWRLINGVDTFLTTLCGRPSLIMPYLQPLSHTERHSPDIQRQVIELIESCAEKNYIQSDAAWRHVGWYKYTQPARLMLLDFGHAEKIRKDALQEQVNIAVSQFCVCMAQEAKSRCGMCAYVEEHDQRAKRRRRK